MSIDITMGGEDAIRCFGTLVFAMGMLLVLLNSPGCSVEDEPIPANACEVIND